MSGICLSLVLAVWNDRHLSVTHSGGLGCQGFVCHSFWQFGIPGIWMCFIICLGLDTLILCSV